MNGELKKYKRSGQDMLDNLTEEADVKGVPSFVIGSIPNEGKYVWLLYANCEGRKLLGLDLEKMKDMSCYRFVRGGNNLASLLRGELTGDVVLPLLIGEEYQDFEVIFNVKEGRVRVEDKYALPNSHYKGGSKASFTLVYLKNSHQSGSIVRIREHLRKEEELQKILDLALRKF